MGLSFKEFQAFQKAKAKQPQAVKQPVVSVVQAKPNQTIFGVVQAQPNQTITTPSFKGPIQPRGPSVTPAATLFKDYSVPSTKNTTAASLLISKDRRELDEKVAPSTSKIATAGRFAWELPGAFGTKLKEAARALPRAGLSVLSSAFNPDSAEPITAETPGQKFLVGDEPVTPIARRVSDLELSGKTYAENLKAQGHPDLAGAVEKGTLPFAMATVIGETTLDLYPGGGGRQKIVKQASSFLAEQLAKGVVKDEALNLMYKRFGAVVSKEVEQKVLPKILEKAATEVSGTIIPKAAKERGFITTVKESARTAPQVSSKITGNYTPITNNATMKAAQELIAKDINQALKVAKQTRPTAKSIATAQALISKYQQEGNFEAAIDLVEVTAKKLTQSGQAIQAASMYNRLTPDGILQFAERQLRQAGEKSGKDLKLTPELVTKLRKQAEDLVKLPEGSREKIVETGNMLKTIADEIPSNILQKISMGQTMAQLLNPKTLTRNIIGNTGFAVAENVKDTIAAPLDWLISKVTGQRTKSLPSLTKQFGGFKKGLKEGFQDAWLGIDTSAAATQFDLPKGQVFKNKIMQGLEKTLSIALKAPDRAAYQAAFENSLSSQLKLAKVAEATPEMLHIAHLDGLYRTFQDDSLAAKAFVGIKKALNMGKDFGLGDLVLKYPKTPGNLLARGIDYSPAGFFKSTIELAKPLFGREFNQRAFVESTSRALTGTAGLVGTGALLHRLGIITGKRDSDNDINALERSTGLGQYKINLSGLMRFVLSGFDADEAKLKEGDKTVSYDWFQPAAIGISIGANIDENKGSAKGAVGTFLASLGEGVDTLGEQPLVQGFTRPFRYSESISDAFLQALQGVPTSFIPTLLGQIRQVVDPKQRNTQDPDYVKKVVNLAKNKIPGLSERLPEKYGAFGEQLKNEQGPLATFFSPAFLDKYATTPEQKMVLDIYKNSGLKTQAPRLVEKKQTVNGKSIEITGEQQSKMQKMIGELTKERFEGLAVNSKFLKLSDEDKAKELSAIMTDISSAVRYEVLGNRPKKLNDRTKKYIKILRQTSQ